MTLAKQELTADIKSKNPDVMLTQLLALMKELKSIYTKELSILQANDHQAFMALQPFKESLSRDYEIRIKEIQTLSTLVKQANPALRQQIIDEQAELAILADNAQGAAQRMALCMKRLQERLILAARHAINQEKIRYGAAGTLSESLTAKPIATAINEAI